MSLSFQLFSYIDKLFAFMESFKDILVNFKKYTLAKKEAKKVVNKAKNETFERLYQKLDTKEGERDIYRIAKAREKKTRDVTQIKCIKDECNRVLVNDGEIKERWKRYFHQLFNEGLDNQLNLGNLSRSNEYRNLNFYRKIQTSKIEQTLNKMKNGKTVRPDDIPIEVWKCLGKQGSE